MPLLKRGAATVGRQALQTGMEIAEDVMGGQNVKAATKRRLKQAGRQLGSKAARKIQTGRGKKKRNKNRKPKAKTGRVARRAPRRGKGIKRRRTGQNASMKSNKRRSRTYMYNDIFV